MQINPSDIGRGLMIFFAVLGVALIIDSIMFMTKVQTLTNYVGLSVYFDERVRAVAIITIGLLSLAFGVGYGTVAVGGIAIITVLIMSYSNYWGAKGWKGTDNNRTTTVQTDQSAAPNQNNGNAIRYRCPLDDEQLDWCTEDHDNDGTQNQFDAFFNGKGQGIQNCKSKSYITATKTSNQCKVIK